MRRSGHTVRITAQLINAVTGFHLWSKTYDRDLGDVLQLPTEIATAVADALKVTLLGDVAVKIELGGRGIPPLFDAYLHGLKLVQPLLDCLGMRNSLQWRLDSTGNRRRSPHRRAACYCVSSRVGRRTSRPELSSRVVWNLPPLMLPARAHSPWPRTTIGHCTNAAAWRAGWVTSMLVHDVCDVQVVSANLYSHSSATA